jgi:hypothetical protein
MSESRFAVVENAQSKSQENRRRTDAFRQNRNLKSRPSLNPINELAIVHSGRIEGGRVYAR